MVRLDNHGQFIDSRFGQLLNSPMEELLAVARKFVTRLRLRVVFNSP